MANILVIDDDDQTRSVIQQMLERGGHQVATAANGEAGLTHAREEKPRLIFLDVLMPDKDGLQVLQELSFECPGIPVVIMSGGMKGNSTWSQIAKKVGAVKVLRKPFDKEALLDCVEQIIPPVAKR